MRLFFLSSQVIAVSKSSDIVLMVLDASKVSVCLFSVLAADLTGVDIYCSLLLTGKTLFEYLICLLNGAE
jgi:hypothetical protein